MNKKSLAALFVLLVSSPLWALSEDEIPQRISVMPVFFVPKGETGPTQKHIEMVQKHLEISQQQYRNMLKERDTFAISQLEPRIIHDSMSLASLKNLAGDKRSQYMINKLLKEFDVNRFNCPYVFWTVVMSPKATWLTAGGRPLNGGFNGGGGFICFSSRKLDAEVPRIQGCLLHELGHAFGLVHVDSYGYDQKTNKSIMSYNEGNMWSGYSPPKEYGILIPEDIRGLSMNKRVFPVLYFDDKQDVPEGYHMGKLIRLSYDTKIPGQEPYEIKVTTNSGLANGTSLNNIVLGYTHPNRKVKNGIGLNAGAMWMSEKTQDGWIDLELEFPIAVRMNRICVQSQCGGGFYPVKSMRLEAEADRFNEVARVEMVQGDEAYISFNEVKARQWRLWFKPDESGQVVIRGLRFYSSQGEIFSHLIPTYLISK